MLILDGKAVSEIRKNQLKIEVDDYKMKYSESPRLDVVLVGEDPASHVYVKNKVRACEKVGIQSKTHLFKPNRGPSQLAALIQELNEDDRVNAILVQFPLPEGFHQAEILKILKPKKDVDGLTAENLGLLWSGRKRVCPCTPMGIMTILNHYKISLAGKKAVVIGRSLLVGKPMTQLLLESQATVTLCHSKTENLKFETQQADLVVVAAGRQRFLSKDHFKQGAVVVDVGIHKTKEGQLCGDVDNNGLENWVSALTPVPGGVGPMTIATLLENTLTLARLQRA
jgi:methylenetetrahydrofolate dehydrogenase (NADP+) / methenyltetrahydrofolate cyclohydrolase